MNKNGDVLFLDVISCFRIQTSVMRVIEGTLDDVLALMKQEGEGNDHGGLGLAQLLEEFVVVVKRRLLFSSRLEYLYASQLKAVQTKAVRKKPM